jgi:hypothetical protein
MKAADIEAKREAIQSVNDVSAGLLNVSIVDAGAWAGLLAHALMGDRGSEALLQAVVQAGARVEQAPRRLPALCLCCPRAVKRISANTVFGVAMPVIGKPTGAVGFVFCDRCASDRSALPTKAITGLRRIWPELRQVEITHPVGGQA